MKLGLFIHMLTGSEYIIRHFERNNVDTVFGYSGGANLHLFDKLGKSNLKLVVNRHEQFVGHSAEGYAKASGKFGVAITTSGPGLTNIITPLQDALSDSVPLVCISGQVSSKVLGTNAFQEVDAIGLTKSCTKWNFCVKEVEDLHYALEHGFKIARQGKKGPVHIDVCSDVLSSEIPEQQYGYTEKLAPYKLTDSDLGSLFEITSLINQAKRPVLIVGKGAYPAIHSVRRFSKAFNIPVATTLHAVGLVDEREELSLGMVGMHGTAYANKAVQMADLIIGVGYRFDDRTVGNLNTYGINAKKHFGIVHIDIDQENLDLVRRLVEPKISLQMDSKTFFKEIIVCPVSTVNSYRRKWIEEVKELKKKYPLGVLNSQVKKLRVPQVIQELGRQMKNKDCLVTTGVGNHQMMTAQYFGWSYPQRLMTSGSLGTMGVGVPFAIGAKFAFPNTTVICIDGDGSFMMSAQELATIVEYNLPVKILIMNDARLQMVHTWQDLFYQKNFVSTCLKNPSFKKLGNAFGIKSFVCGSKKSLSRQIRKVLDYDGPVLCEFLVEPETCLPFVKPGSSLDDMIL